MQSLGLNLASRPFRNNLLLWVLHGAAVAGLALFTWYSVSTYVVYRASLTELRGQVDSSETMTATLQQRAFAAQRSIDEFDLEMLTVQASKANEIIEWKAFSWTALFNRLASIQPHAVKMTEIRPVFRGRSLGGAGQAEFDDGRLSVPVLVEGVAKDFDALLEFQNTLFADPHFDRVEPQRMQRAQDTREFVFTLGFLYFPDVTVPESEPAPTETARIAVPTGPEAEAAVQATPVAADVGEPAAVEVDDPAFAGETPGGPGEVASAAAAPDAAVSDDAAAAKPPARSGEARRGRTRPPAAKSPGGQGERR